MISEPLSVKAQKVFLKEGDERTKERISRQKRGEKGKWVETAKDRIGELEEGVGSHWSCEIHGLK